MEELWDNLQIVDSLENPRGRKRPISRNKIRRTAKLAVNGEFALYGFHGLLRHLGEFQEVSVRIVNKADSPTTSLRGIVHRFGDAFSASS